MTGTICRDGDASVKGYSPGGEGRFQPTYIPTTSRKSADVINCHKQSRKCLKHFFLLAYKLCLTTPFPLRLTSPSAILNNILAVQGKMRFVLDMYDEHDISLPQSMLPMHASLIVPTKIIAWEGRTYKRIDGRPQGYDEANDVDIHPCQSVQSDDHPLQHVDLQNEQFVEPC